MSSYPTYLQGTQFRLYRGQGDGPPETFSFVCIATTLDLEEKIDTDDIMAPNCDEPLALPQRVSIPTSRTWDVSFSGTCDHGRYLRLRAQLGTPGNWQVLTDAAANVGGGNYQGQAVLTDLKLTKNDNKTVTFTASLKGNFDLVFTPAAT